MAATHAATGQELITLVIRESDARAAAACGQAACGQVSEYYSPACSGNKHRFALPPSRKLKYKYKNTKDIAGQSPCPGVEFSRGSSCPLLARPHTRHKVTSLESR